MFAIQRQSGNHEGTFFFKYTYLFNMDDCLAKKKSRVLDFRAEPSKKKSGLAAEPRPLGAMPSHYPSS